MLAMYLFLINEGIVEYRNACKKYGVDEPVKVLDREALQKYLGVVGKGKEKDKGSSSDKADDGSGEVGTSSSKKDKYSKKSSSAKKDRRHGSSSEQKRSRASNESSSLTKEKVLANLTIVADKRADAVVGSSTTQSQSQMVGGESQSDSQPQSAEAGSMDVDNTMSFLSADGFDVDDVDALEEDRKKVEEITKYEIAVGDASSVLRAWDARSLSRVLELYNENKKGGSSRKPGSSSNRKRDSKSSSVARGSAEKVKRARNKVYGLPVIVLPNAISSPVTMINAKEFFCDAKYIPSDVLKKRGARKSSTLKFKRAVGQKFGGKEIEYEIVDNPQLRFGTNKDEWNRIVAVVAQGAEWQFKGWRWSNPVQIFTNTFGFFISMEGEPIPPSLVGWNVTQSKLNRDKRGLDSVTYASFWNKLDEWMLVNKPEYLPKLEA